MTTDNTSSIKNMEDTSRKKAIEANIDMITEIIKIQASLDTILGNDLLDIDEHTYEKIYDAWASMNNIVHKHSINNTQNTLSEIEEDPHG